MGWSIALACAIAGPPEEVFTPGLRTDPDVAADIARRLHPAAGVIETGDTILDFALWPYDDELFVGAYGDALIVCDRRLFSVDDDARLLADSIASVLPDSRCGVLVLHPVISGCWFRWYDRGVLQRDVFVTAEDGVVVDQGSRLAAEQPFWSEIDRGAADLPLPFDHESFGLELARHQMFGRALTDRGADGFLPLELPLRRFKLR